MHQQLTELPAAVETPDAVIQRSRDFGDLDGRGMDLVRVKLGPGADTAPLLEGLEDDLCPVPHWGYVVDGEVFVQYTDGTEEVNRTGDAVHWPPGHTLHTEDEEADLVLFSPEEEHGHLIDHIERKIDEMGAE